MVFKQNFSAGGAFVHRRVIAMKTLSEQMQFSFVYF